MWISVQPNGAYKANYRGPDGRIRSRTFPRGRKAEAKGWAAEQERKIRRREWRDPKAGEQPLGGYFDAFLAGAHDLAPSTRATYETESRLYVKPALGDFPLAGIAPQDVRAFLADLVARGVGARTVQLSRQTLSRVLRQAVEDGIIPANPAARISVPKTDRRPIRILTVGEVERLADAITPRFRLLVLVGAFGGLRFREVTALRRSRVRLLSRRVDVVEGLTEVRGHTAFGPLKTPTSRRTVTIPRSLADELGAHMGEFMRPASEDPGGMDLVFTAREGGPIRRTAWRRRHWEPAVRSAGIEPPPVFHHLRHTAAALAIAADAHPKAIQARLGHASITTTLNLYGHLFPGLDEDLADRLDDARRNSAAFLLPPGSSEVVTLSGAEAGNAP